MRTPVVLVLGFEPFADEAINPSAEIARRLDGELIAQHHVVSGILPVTFTDAPTRLAELLDQHRPQLVIALGQAGGRGEISLERVAINLIDARIADNAGLQPIDAEVLHAGPGAYFSTLPIKAIREELEALNVPSALSLSAGTYVCNQVAYWLGHLLATEHAPTRGGFIHVPWLPEQASRHPGEPSMPLEVMISGIRAAIECSLRTTTDLHVSGGTTH
ncbi:MAG TPA: pyroglutamyl-peptidase I [Dokdonella sp.]|uniref:pyroglutamyl-peptidase I n=1 Tax=Dokdonella sp. TaxID=2291710 RepID=UPI002D8034E1|nr:pyroglutamyl-peptidase I [Dokdonella sp.]HET9032358.1 pyroglutamyl-peptidase I [Dokdonella sp.]